MRAGVVLAVLVVLWAQPAFAHPRARPERITVIAEPGTDREQAQIAEDLRAQGYDVVLVQEEWSDPKPPLTSAFRAVASVRLRRDGAAIELWIARGAGRTAELLKTVAPTGQGSSERSDAAVYAIELLRAELLEVRAAPGRTEIGDSSSSRSAPTVRQPARPWAPVVGVASGFGALTGFGSTGVNWLVPIRIRVLPAESWSFELSAAATVAGSTVTRSEGRTTISTAMIGVDVWRSLAPGKLVDPLVGAGIFLARVALRPEANPGYVSNDDTRLSCVPHVGAGVQVRLDRHLRVRFDVLGGHALPPLELRFDERNVGQWGPVVLSSGATLEAAF